MTDEEQLNPEVTNASDEIQADNVEQVLEEEDESLAFPNARIVKIMREEIRSGKQIRSEVKAAVNEWLGNVLRKVAREMDKTQYGSIGLADFQRATMPFDMIDHLVKDKERLMICMDKLKLDADQIKRDFFHFYGKITNEKADEPQ